MALLDWTVLRFLSVGVANTLIGLFAIYFAMFVLGLGNILANAMGYLIGLLVSFVLNKRWTFEHDGQTTPALLRFVVVIGVAYLANLTTVLMFADGFGLNRYLAQAMGIVPYTAVGYLGSRYIAFPRTTAS